MRKQSLLVMVFLAVPLAIILPKIHQPLSDYDYQDVSAAEDVLAGGKGATYIGEEPGFWHPPLYIRSLALALKIAGPDRTAGRWVGVLCFLASALLIYRFSQDLAPENKQAGPLSLAFYASHPLVLQGVFLMDHSDTSLLPLCLTLFWWLKVRVRAKKRGVRIAVLGLAFCLCLWSKTTTSLVAAGTWGILFLIQREKSELAVPLAGVLSGTALFTATWYLFCRFQDIPHFWVPLGVIWEWIPGLLQRASTAPSPTGYLKAPLEVLRITLWFSPFLLMAWVQILSRRLKSGRLFSHQEGDELRLFSLLMLAGYTIIGSTINGFPKYQSPVLPVLCVLAAVRISREWGKEFWEQCRGKFLLAVGGVCVLNLIVTGDVLYNLNYDLRSAAIFGGLSKAVLPLVVKILLIFSPLLPVFLFLKKGGKSPAWAGSLAALFIGTSLAWDFLQARAPYNTLYAYGAAGKSEVIKRLKSRPLPDRALALHEITYDLGTPPISRSLWLDREKTLESLKDPQTSVFICGLQTHTVGQLKWFFLDTDFQRVLDENYGRTDIGSFRIYERKQVRRKW